jgi:hypothetical protein
VDHTSAEDPAPANPPGGRGLTLRARGPSPIAVAAGFGAIWGAVAFAVLWGYTSIQVTRPFVESVAGLVTLLPVRIVLYGIHVLEARAGRSFHLASNHEWIGFVSAAVGAAIVALAFAAGRALIRAGHRRLRRTHHPGGGRP